jgi:hypothetical protein
MVTAAQIAVQCCRRSFVFDRGWVVQIVDAPASVALVGFDKSIASPRCCRVRNSILDQRPDHGASSTRMAVRRCKRFYAKFDRFRSIALELQRSSQRLSGLERRFDVHQHEMIAVFTKVDRRLSGNVEALCEWAHASDSVGDIHLMKLDVIGPLRFRADNPVCPAPISDRDIACPVGNAFWSRRAPGIFYLDSAWRGDGRADDGDTERERRKMNHAPNPRDILLRP